MAESTINAQVLFRNRRAFTPKGEVEEIVYFEAVLFDPKTHELYVYRSGNSSDFEGVDVGKSVKDFAVTVDKRTNVRATLVRPLRDDSEGTTNF